MSRCSRLCSCQGALVLGAVLAVAPVAAEPQLAPTWEGALDVGMRLRLVLHLEQDPAGGLRATIDSPDQGAFGLPFESVRLEKGVLRLRSAQLGAEYEGRLNDHADEMAGTWRQRGSAFPLRLMAVAAVSKLSRPQTPAPPFPYRSEEVAFPSRASGITLTGTFTCPQGQGPFPAVVLVSGSGPSDRDETLFEHRPFLVLADHLTRRGIAVLRFDDRGVGGSSRGPEQATTRDLAADPLGGVAWLAQRPEVDARRVGLVGHSEGAQVALFAANDLDTVGFVVMMAGPGLPGERLLELQTEAIARAEGVPELQIAALLAANRQAYAIAKAPGDDAAARLTPLFDSVGIPREAQAAQMLLLLSPWFRFFLEHDPAGDLARLRVPLLAVVGDKDAQVVAKPHQDAIRQALEAARHQDHTLTILPGLNHLLQECLTGSISEYAAIEQTLAPAALEAISGWITAHTSARDGAAEAR